MCRSSGFSLIEMLVAISVFGLGTLALLSLFVADMASNRLSSEITEATDLAQALIEEISNGSYADALAANYPDEPIGSIDGYPQFSRVVQIQENVPSAGFKTVSVISSWVNSDSGETQSVTLRTIISEEVSK